MKQFAIFTIAIFTVSIVMTSCMREKFNHGLPRNNYERPRPPKKFVKATPAPEKIYAANIK